MDIIISGADLDIAIQMIMFGFGFLAGVLVLNSFARGFNSNAR